MPHDRERHIKKLLLNSLKFSSIVGILGHRQVGKTTLASSLTSKYFTLDIRQTLNQLEEDPLGFLEHNKGAPLVIDECQLSPDLFPAMKEYVRVNKKPGQLLITGSVRFTSRKVIKESLTGRIVNWELLPMDYSELKHLPLPDSIIKFIQSKNVELEIKNKPVNLSKEVTRYLINGGLPGIFSIRNDAIRNQKFETQLQAIFERDLKLIFDTTLSLRTINSFASYLAGKQGMPLNLAEASRTTRISVPTARKLLSAFEAMFIVRLYDSEGEQKTPVLYYEDQGEASYLTSGLRTDLQMIEHYLYANLRCQWMYRPELQVKLTQYRTRSGALVPFVLRSPKGVLGIIPSLEDNPNQSAYGSANSFLKANPEAKVLYVHLGNKDMIINSRERSLPLGLLIT